MTIAISGGTGFVGRAVLVAATRQPAGVRALARQLPAQMDGIHWVQGDLGNAGALDRLMEGADTVIHIAGLTTCPDVDRFDIVNVDGTAAMIAAAKRQSVDRFIFVSSLSAREPALSRYGSSKFTAEGLVRNSGLNWTIVRPPAVYGPHDRDLFELFRAAKFGVIPLPPRGATSIIHVDDLAQLLLTLIPPSSHTRHALFEPDDGRIGGWSHVEMAAAIGRAMGRSVYPLSLPAWALHLAAHGDRIARGDKARLTQDRIGYMLHPNWVARSNNAVPATIWTPRIATPDGLAATAQWYREQGWL